MLKKFIRQHQTVPRWVILLIDLFIISVSFGMSYFISEDFEFIHITRGDFFLYNILFLITSLPFFISLRIQSGLIRFSTLHDIFLIFTSMAIISIVYLFVIYLNITPVFNTYLNKIIAVVIINYFICTSFMILLRILAKEVYSYIKLTTGSNEENILIYGTDADSILVKHLLEASLNEEYQIAGFIDSNPRKINAYIEQKKVYHVDELMHLKKNGKVKKMIVINEKLYSPEKKSAIEKCLSFDIKILTVPPSEEWIKNGLKSNQIINLRIDDLLQRDPIQIDSESVYLEHEGKRILITGSAGSIGSEIAKQALKRKPALLLLCDIAESPLNDLYLELKELNTQTVIIPCLADIRSKERMIHIFKTYLPDIVYHAAAYKHVPMLESHIIEAVENNILGTRIVVELATIFQAEKFIMISTDKAVNPTNIMGASKRIAEMFIQSLSIIDGRSEFSSRYYPQIENNHKYAIHYTSRPFRPVTKYITTRFGNVLDSNGSVIPRFRKQIQAGGPITVTHPDITRYFMTIHEAVQLVLEAATSGQSGEIYIFDMGQPVRISDLAAKMIQLSGYEPGKDIQISFTGLRPGEKLYEELLNDEEKTLPTYHPKIKIAKVRKFKYESLVSELNKLELLCRKSDIYLIVSLMKEVVPEFISQNSPFESLDQRKITEKGEIFIKNVTNNN